MEHLSADRQNRPSTSAQKDDTGDCDVQPGSSLSITETESPVELGLGLCPLQRLTIMVGRRPLKLKIISVPPRNDGRSCNATPEDSNHSNSAVNRDEGEMDEEDDSLYDPNGRTSGGDPNGYVWCSYCSREFRHKAALLRHEATEHAGQKPFMCNYCGKGFTHKQSLIMHERIHTGEKPFQCPICTKCFARQTNYNIHMKLHASGRRYFCSCCGKWYRTEHEMLDHEQNCLAQLHGGASMLGGASGSGVGGASDKPLRYQCAYCEKMFHHRRDKNIHERTHTGERPYSCGYCSKGFTQSQALTIHIRTHTGERPYTCNTCAKDFRDSSALRKHEFVKHTSIRSSMSGYGPLGAPEAESLRPIIVPTDQLEAAVFALEHDE